MTVITDPAQSKWLLQYTMRVHIACFVIVDGAMGPAIVGHRIGERLDAKLIYFPGDIKG